MQRDGWVRKALHPLLHFRRERTIGHAITHNRRIRSLRAGWHHSPGQLAVVYLNVDARKLEPQKLSHYSRIQLLLILERPINNQKVGQRGYLRDGASHIRGIDSVRPAVVRGCCFLPKPSLQMCGRRLTAAQTTGWSSARHAGEESCVGTVHAQEPYQLLTSISFKHVSVLVRDVYAFSTFPRCIETAKDMNKPGGK